VRWFRQSTSLIALVCFLPSLVFATREAKSQALPTATGPGSYIQLGAQISGYQIDYGQRYLLGGSGFLDANLYARYGAEIEARTLRINENEGVHETTYLVGPRVSILTGPVRPYIKLLIGRGEFSYPFHDATGSYFVVAPGAGLDWRVRQSRLSLRIVDVEVQSWSGFSFGRIMPYGISSGVAIRVF
jgi:hypothetical protein